MQDPKISQVARMRMVALRAASKVTSSPADLLQAAFAYECYLLLGFNTADGVLRNGVTSLYPAAEPVPQTANYFDQFDAQPAVESPTPADRYVDYLDKLETLGPARSSPGSKLH